MEERNPRRSAFSRQSAYAGSLLTSRQTWVVRSRTARPAGPMPLAFGAQLIRAASR